MEDTETAEEGTQDVYPPERPKDIHEWLTAKVVVVVDEADGDGENSDGPHREGTGVETLNRVPDHHTPGVGEHDVTDERDEGKDDEKR